jgi:23S rRNA pseudouridine1911/1915/1917 synthase
MLHAASLGFTHPVTGRILDFESPAPTDMTELIKRLKEKRRPLSG